MRILFWSCRPGLAAVSSSMLAVACTASCKYKMHTSIMQTQYNCNNLQYPFFKLSDKENVEQYSSAGIDPLIRTVHGGSINREAIQNCAISFLDSRLALYTQSVSVDKKMYRDGLYSGLPNILKALDNAYSVSFIDTTAGNDEISKLAIENADVIVVCFPQAEWLINYFFSKYKLNNKKVFYLIGNYDSAGAYNLAYLKKKYKKEVTVNNSGVIPHCTDFLNALNNSSITSFFAKNVECSSNNPNYTFFTEVASTTKKLLNFAGLSI